MNNYIEYVNLVQPAHVDDQQLYEYFTGPEKHECFCDGWWGLTLVF